MLNKDLILQKLALIVSNLDETSLQDLSDVLENLDFSANEQVRLSTGWAVEEDNSIRMGFINVEVNTKKNGKEVIGKDCWDKPEEVLVA